MAAVQVAQLYVATERMELEASSPTSPPVSAVPVRTVPFSTPSRLALPFDSLPVIDDSWIVWTQQTEHRLIIRVSRDVNIASAPCVHCTDTFTCHAARCCSACQAAQACPIFYHQAYRRANGLVTY